MILRDFTLRITNYFMTFFSFFSVAYNLRPHSPTHTLFLQWFPTPRRHPDRSSRWEARGQRLRLLNILSFPPFLLSPAPHHLQTIVNPTCIIMCWLFGLPRATSTIPLMGNRKSYSQFKFWSPCNCILLHSRRNVLGVTIKKKKKKCRNSFLPPTETRYYLVYTGLFG